MSSIHINRTELYKRKGQLTLSPAEDETQTPPNAELNETLAEIITKKFKGDDNAQP
jgi:hypothetical protein